MAEDLIRYDVLAQEALRGVLRKVLTEASRAGLPGEHHFYIAFDTRAPGVRISSRLRERYPEEITIVLQHQFWDLVVNEQSFEVGLAFGGVPEKLVVPFTAIKGFFDPSVEFGLQFDVVRGVDDEEGEASVSGLAAPNLAGPGGSAQPTPFPIVGAGTQENAAQESVKQGEDADGDRPAQEDKAPAGGEHAGAEQGSAAVVSLDAFRKKST